MDIIRQLELNSGPFDKSVPLQETVWLPWYTVYFDALRSSMYVISAGQALKEAYLHKHSATCAIGRVTLEIGRFYCRGRIEDRVKEGDLREVRRREQ